MIIKRESAKDKLIKAFFEELEKTHYSKISVSTLIEKAGVSRTTFYRHYVDIYDMYEKVCKDFIEKFIITTLTTSTKAKIKYNESFFENLFKMLKEQEKYILLLSEENGDRRFFDKGLQIAENALSFFVKTIGQKEVFKIKFIIYAGASAYFNCIMHKEKFDIDVLEFTKKILNIS